MISAALIERSKLVFPDGSIMEIVIWKVPEPVPGSAHLFKYRLFYGRNEIELSVSTMNAARGIIATSTAWNPYAFTSTDALLSDFRKEIVKRRQQQ
jgi:hypothetical protein